MAGDFGSFGAVAIKRATSFRRSQPYPVAEADVALGVPSTQALSRKLEDIIIELTFVGAEASKDAEVWRALGKGREPQQLVIAGKPEGLYWIALVDEEIRHAITTRIDSTVLRITFKEVGAFAWVGNYSPYEPPESVRPSAEGGVSGLSKEILGWLNK